MDLENKNKKSKRQKHENQENREQFRVVISPEANAAIEVALKRVTDGFEAGVVTKSDVANFVFLNLSKFLSDADVKSLRAAHFNEKRMLGALLRNDDELPDELRKALRAHFGVGEKEKRRPSRSPSAEEIQATINLSSPPPAA